MAEPLSIASGAAGLVSLGISVCHGLLEYYQSYRQSGIAVENMYTQLISLSRTLGLIEGVLSSTTTPWDPETRARAEESIEVCRSATQALDKKLRKVKVSSAIGKSEPTEKIRSFVHKASFPFRESTLVRLKEIILELRGDLGLVLSVLQL